MPDTKASDKPLVIVGDEDIVMGFQALGFQVYPLKEESDFTKILDEIVEKKAAVCLIQEEIYRANQELINKYKSLALPVFMPFGGNGKSNLLDIIIKDIRLKATGAL